MRYFNPKFRVYVTKDEKALNGMEPAENGGWQQADDAEGEFIPVQEGNMIVTEDGGAMYFDLEEKRIQIAPVWKELQ